MEQEVENLRAEAASARQEQKDAETQAAEAELNLAGQLADMEVRNVSSCRVCWAYRCFAQAQAANRERSLQVQIQEQQRTLESAKEEVEELENELQLFEELKAEAAELKTQLSAKKCLNLHKALAQTVLDSRTQTTKLRRIIESVQQEKAQVAKEVTALAEEREQLLTDLSNAVETRRSAKDAVYRAQRDNASEPARHNQPQQSQQQPQAQSRSGPRQPPAGPSSRFSRPQQSEAKVDDDMEDDGAVAAMLRRAEQLAQGGSARQPYRSQTAARDQEDSPLIESVEGTGRGDGGSDDGANRFESVLGEMHSLREQVLSMQSEVKALVDQSSPGSQDRFGDNSPYAPSRQQQQHPNRAAASSASAPPTHSSRFTQRNQTPAGVSPQMQLATERASIDQDLGRSTGRSGGNGGGAGGESQFQPSSQSRGRPSDSGASRRAGSRDSSSDSLRRSEEVRRALEANAP